MLTFHSTRQRYSENTVLFNLPISGNDAFSAMCDGLLEYKYREIFVLVLGVICSLLSEVE